MQYIKITFLIDEGEAREVLMALMTDIGYEGFEETQTTLAAYIPDAEFNKEDLEWALAGNAITYTIETIPQQNWNSQWEENFQPVIVEGFCTIRADFHQLHLATPYEIIITPKMSFGTGHHATTQLMMMQMKELDFKGRSVLDFGTGTGILAILAEMLGATDILAIDNDEWSYENAQENISRNNSQHISVQQSSLDGIENKFGVILANINRHILLQYMAQFPALLQDQGTILMSGLLKEDKEVILPEATKNGLILKGEQELNGWIVLNFAKS
jgi:ribosomal protein L11 methyltransferase